MLNELLESQKWDSFFVYKRIFISLWLYNDYNVSNISICQGDVL